MESILFELTEGNVLKYANGSGQEIDGTIIELYEPTGKVSHICMEIEGLIQAGLASMSSMFDQDELEEARAAVKDEPTVIDADAVLGMMTSGGVNMKKIVLNYRELFKEVAKIGAEKPMTIPLMDRMTHHDFRRMMGEYTANFILKSS